MIYNINDGTFQRRLCVRMRVCVFDGKRNWEYSLSFVTGKWKTFFESKLFQVIPGGGEGRRKERGKFPARNHWNDTWRSWD